MTNCGELLAEVFKFLMRCRVFGEEIGLLLLALHANERVSRDKLRFQVRQRTHTAIELRFINVLVHDERDEEPHLGDLNRDGLDVHAVMQFSIR